MEPNNGIMDRRADGVLSIRQPTSEEWRLSAGWLIATIVGGLLPLWGSYLMLKLGSQSVSVADFVSHGEFALYSASLLAPVFFIILRELPAGFPFRLWIGLVSVVLLLISALTFGCVFWIDRVPEGDDAPVLNVGLLIVLSFVLYLCSVSVAYGVTLLEMVRPTYDPYEVQRQQIDDLNAQMRRGED